MTKPIKKAKFPKLKVHKAASPPGDATGPGKSPAPAPDDPDFYFVHYLEANTPPAVGYAAHTAIAKDEADAEAMKLHLHADGRLNVVIVPGAYAK